jgi:hypothetical protein
VDAMANIIQPSMELIFWYDFIIARSELFTKS